MLRRPGRDTDGGTTEIPALNAPVRRCKPPSSFPPCRSRPFGPHCPVLAIYLALSRIPSRPLRRVLAHPFWAKLLFDT
jgi:hypothetical protein